jgi:hypothetical protein
LTKNVNLDSWNQDGTNRYDKEDSTGGHSMFLKPPKGSLKGSPRSRSRSNSHNNDSIPGSQKTYVSGQHILLKVFKEALEKPPVKIIDKSTYKVVV